MHIQRIAANVRFLLAIFKDAATSTRRLPSLQQTRTLHSEVDVEQADGKWPAIFNFVFPCIIV